MTDIMWVLKRGSNSTRFPAPPLDEQKHTTAVRTPALKFFKVVLTYFTQGGAPIHGLPQS
jgi:hypothetical protein